MHLPRRVDKPWGHELWYALTDRYAGKILHVEAGHRLSLQFHHDKDESNYLLSGRLKLIKGTSADDARRDRDRPGPHLAQPAGRDPHDRGDRGRRRCSRSRPRRSTTSSGFRTATGARARRRTSRGGRAPTSQASLRRVAAVLVLLVVLVAIVAILALAPGSYETYPRSDAADRRRAACGARLDAPLLGPPRAASPEPFCAHV